MKTLPANSRWEQRQRDLDQLTAAERETKWAEMARKLREASRELNNLASKQTTGGSMMPNPPNTLYSGSAWDPYGLYNNLNNWLPFEGTIDVKRKSAREELRELLGLVAGEEAVSVAVRRADGSIDVLPLADED